MKPVIISVFLLSFFLSIDASPIRCYKCHAKNSETCAPTIQQCMKGERCGIMSEQYIYNKTFCSVWKGCVANVPCNETPYSFVNKDVSTKVNIQCCDTDLCNIKMYEMPKEEEMLGPKCPSCFNPNSTEECVPDGETTCRAIDDKCMTFAGTVEKPDGNIETYSAKGCMSSIGCSLILDQIVGCHIMEEKIFRCDDISPKPSNRKEEEKNTISLVPGSYV
ncbi:uncharacterized protein [Engystomops pustulosus]|uniref:uncharacterized protein n=1 Tax=Engystomops pustulosus TaxID=76066 RepID=UPI003AFA1906